MIDKVERTIRQAIEEGQFEDLPGKGKPLKLDQNPYEDPEWRLAYRVLRNGGFSLPWIEARKEIENELEAARLSLGATWSRLETDLSTVQSVTDRDAEWHRAIELFRERIDKINQLISSYNLRVPSSRFQMNKKDVDREIELTIASLSDKLTKRNRD